MRALRRPLLLTGLTSLLLLVSLTLILLSLHRLGGVNIWQMPLKHMAAFLGFGGFACFVGYFVLGLMQPSAKSSSRRVPIGQRVAVGLLLVFVSLNIPTYLLAYHMTHLPRPSTADIRPSRNGQTPADRGLSYVTHNITVDEGAWLETWLIPASAAKGTVVLFPGNQGSKRNQLIGPAQTFHALGYNCLLVDFQGLGGSSGNTTTIGLKESADVAKAAAFVNALGLPSPFILYGVSMGSAAILRAIDQKTVAPDAVVLELPFATFLNAIRSRLRFHRLPPFPTAELTAFWGSVQHGVNGFSHNPVDYAKAVDCPALVIHGAQDKWTQVDEVRTLFENLSGPKQLVISPDAGHHQLIGVDRDLWETSVAAFLEAQL